MVDKVCIEKLRNGWLVSDSWYTPDKTLAAYHPDWISIIKNLDGVYAEVERDILRNREKAIKEQVREEITPATKKVEGPI